MVPWLTILLLIAGAGAAVLALKLFADLVARRRSYWGLTFRRIECPKCSEPVPRFRKPATTRQAIWGGWTCRSCGAELDRSGTDISSDVARTKRIKRPRARYIDDQGRSPVERLIDDPAEDHKK